jgi:N-acetyl-alpha-D-muramate 1-phosphate uridylyltransferase
MKAMIFAAGLGKRMGKLTHNYPKPLLLVKNQPLLAYHLQALAEQNFQAIVINTSYHAQLLKDFIETWQGNNQNLYPKLKIEILYEPTPLEIGGGIINALPVLGNEPFLVVNADLYGEHFPFAQLKNQASLLNGESCLGHLMMVPNPFFLEQGDFYLNDYLISEVPAVASSQTQNILNSASKKTYAGIAVFHPKLFKGFAPGVRSLRSILLPAIHQQLITGELYLGPWINVGSPLTLAQANNFPMMRTY